jgi:hypothetical protein
MPRSIPTKAERFAEFLRRLGEAPPASSFDEAYRRVCEILDAVEGEMTSIPYDPSSWRTDGRLYPPQMDNAKVVPGRPDLKRFRSKSHGTTIGANGAIEVREISGGVVLTRPGADGQGL